MPKENAKSKKANEALRENEERYRIIVASSPSGIYQTDVDGNCVFVNERWCLMSGLTPEQAYGEGWLKGIYSEDRQLVADSWYRMVQSEGKWGLEYRFHSSVGGITWVYGIAQSIKDDDGNVVAYVGINTDITERKRAEEALQESEKLHNEAQKVAHIGHWELNPKVGIPVWSDEIFRIFGLEPQQGEPSFTNHATHLHPDDWPSLNDAVTKASMDGTPFDLTFRIVQPTGGIRWMHALGTAIKNKKGEVGKLFGTAQDVTERKCAEEKLKQYSEKLEKIVDERTIELTRAHEKITSSEKLSAIGQLASGIAHDLRNPLSVISNALYFLKLKLNNNDNDLVKKNIDLMSNAVDTSNNIIGDLLKFAVHPSPQFEKVNIEPILDSVLSNIQTVKDVKILTEISPNLPQISADRGQIQRMLQNIIDNAIRAMKLGGILTVRASTIDNTLQIEIEDTGEGIPTKYLEKIFEPLFSTYHGKGGTGLGLSICASIIEAHNGTITVTSKVGQGTTFIVKLPIVK